MATLLDGADLGIRAEPPDAIEPSTYAPTRPPSSSLFARPEGASEGWAKVRLVRRAPAGLSGMDVTRALLAQLVRPG
jgi:hypothetical protein